MWSGGSREPAMPLRNGRRCVRDGWIRGFRRSYRRPRSVLFRVDTPFNVKRFCRIDR
jgi:hypothetical protein